MQTWKRWLALVLTVLMLVSALPMSVLAAETEPAAMAADEVVYNLLDREITVVTDPEKATLSNPYVLFDENGNYVIDVEEKQPVFPYEVQFTCDGITESKWFMDTEDTVEVGGHTFSLNVLDKPVTIGLWIGDDYIPAYPEAKEFVNFHSSSLQSLLPLEERRLEFHWEDWDKYPPSVLRKVKLSAFLGDQQLAEEVSLIWSKVNSNEKKRISSMEDTINLYDLGSSQVILEMIAGSVDQLDKTNVRYVLNIWFTSKKDTWGNDLFAVAIKTNDETQEDVPVFGTYSEMNIDARNNQNSGYLTVGVDGKKWNHDNSHLISIVPQFASGLEDQKVIVYEGRYNTLEQLKDAEAKDITAQMWGGEATGYDCEKNWRFYVTLVWGEEEDTIVMPFRVAVYTEYRTISYYTDIYYEKEAGGRRQDVCTSYDPNDEEYFCLKVKNGIDPGTPLYYGLGYYNPDPNAIDGGEYGVNYIDCAFVGAYATKEEALAAGAVDIKAQLFSWANTGGYLADYSKGVTFSVFDIYGDVHDVKIKTVADTRVEEPEEPEEPEKPQELPKPTPLSADTYFRANGAYVKSERGMHLLSSYVIPVQHDSYYYNGYQTILLLENGGAVADDAIYPYFYAPNTVNVYAGHDNVSGTIQKSGETPVTFQSGKAVHYSAGAEDGVHLKNYWVTFLTQQKGASLFVNGATNSAHIDEETGMPIREVFLNNLYGNKHDIFFANIGDEELTGLYVKLENAKNVQLDPYWTIGATTTLDPFTTTDKTSSYGQLPNVGKIRLIATEGGGGEISGTLTIGSANGGEVTIKLIGLANVPKITTDSVVDGVKYVPYSSVIQTNNMYDETGVEFAIKSGNLPKGLEIKPNGEIYGAPLEYGEFTFTVKANYSGFEAHSEATYTMNILDNTNDNVWNATDEGYKLADWVGETDNDGNLVLSAYQDDLFWTEGKFKNFVGFWLDGEKLVPDEDYIAEEGSTKITIREQTFRKANRGTHTIAAEFREGGKTDGTLKRAAQNYTINISSGSSSGSSTGSSTSKPSTNKKEETPSTTTSHNVYQDVKVNDWFYGDVAWAHENGYMIGYGANRFAPNDKISLPMVVTTLSRMCGDDTNVYADPPYATKYDDIQKGQWYTNAAIWAKEKSLLNVEPFVAEPPLARAKFAVILAKYLAYVGVDVSKADKTVVFADADQMTAEENEAFQILYHFGIFNGVGNNRMDPTGATTRAQLAALLHRVSVFVEKD